MLNLIASPVILRIFSISKASPPNQAPEPTRGIGAILFFQSRWPRVAQLVRWPNKMLRILYIALLTFWGIQVHAKEDAFANVDILQLIKHADQFALYSVDPTDPA